MYKVPPSVGNQAGSHVSTSSSVYSPLESEFGFNRNESQRTTPIEEEEEGEHESFITTNSDLEYDHNGNIVNDPSNQTFQSYMTANDDNPSFSSINLSLMKNNSTELYNSEEANNTYPNPDIFLDSDATPKLGTNPSYDPIDRTPILDDKTPIVDANGFLNDTLSPYATTKGKSPLLPQQELSNKFKRLSMTLQNSQLSKSGDSQNFMTSFQSNVDKANTFHVTKTNRTSNYYNKIHEEQPPDFDAAETSVNNVDARSETSTISNRSSIISDDGYPTARGPSIEETSTNSSTFFFSEKAEASKQGYSNFRGSRVSPLKITKKTSTDSEEIPIRKDLVRDFEKLSTSQTMTEQERNDLFNSRQPLTEQYPNGLNISFTNSVLDPKNLPEETAVDTSTSRTADTSSVPDSVVSSTPLDEEDLSSLFIRALHPFNSSTLQSESDVSICLSFEKDDLAFVHTIDDSGWGEVTLVESLQRGWIPMNYFTIAVTEEGFDEEEDEDEEDGKIPNSHYLKSLFHACGKFLMNPLSHKTRRGNFTFSIRVVNSIRDGVRLLLQETDCLSRSNEIVTKRPVVRKSRKTLLADWYSLMIKANEFKGTSNFNKIEILTLMVYQVIIKATSFLQVWSIESKQIIKRENEKKLQSDMNNYPLLSTPPSAKQRVTEINTILYSYLGMIIGRLDLIEHNSEACEILEVLAHQIILLLRELLFISKTGSDFSLEKPADLDGSLDMLLSLVSDLVTSVKTLVIRTLNETRDEKKNVALDSSSKDYYYTQEGGDLIQIASKMVKAISTTIASIRNLLEVTGDFKLNAERSYPDYAKMKIEPDEFIKKCSIGIAKSQSVKNRDIKALRPKVTNSSHRYSMMRSGHTGALSITPNGASLLHDTLISDVDGSSPFNVSNPEFEPFTNKDVSFKNDIRDELLVDQSGNLLGASFKGLVYTLTNETSPPEYFFVSTFFICFRSFASGIDLIEELITRFDVSNKGTNSNDLSAELRLKNRRRLIVKMFQLLMESYWNHERDYSLLTTLINFFNEGISEYLPLDAMKLIEIAAQLSSKPLVESQKGNRPVKSSKQLVNRNITIARLNRKNSIAGLSKSSSENSLSARYSMVDGYELSKINTNSSAATTLKSMTLPMPLGVGNQTSSSSTLLTKNQLITIEKVDLTYRSILGDSWCSATHFNSKNYIPLDLASVLPKWFTICDQNWVLSNYRPNLLDFNGLEIAKQLTVIESAIFCSIKPEELLNENFTVKRAHLKLAPNVRQSLLFTNCLSGYVLESILQAKITMKMRVNIVKTWLKVAISCLYLRNFNSLAAIITSLQSHLITRLTKVWSELSDKYKELYEYLSGIVHPEKNYNVYRSKLRNFLVSNDYNIPIVPYFSLFLQDLTFVTDGNPNYRKANTFLNQKLINIDKYLKITRIIADIESLQIPYVSSSGEMRDNKRSSLLFGGSGNLSKNDLEDYNIISLPSLQELILLELWKVCQLNRKEEDRAWKLSCLIQPRDVN